MATPHRSLHKSRSGVLRAEAATGTPTSSSSMASSPLARSSSTPYHLYAASKGGEASSPSPYAHSPSPFISGSPYASSSRLGGTRAAFGAGAAHSPVRRKGTSFGSPGMKATAAATAGAAAGSSAAPSPSMLTGQRTSGRKSNAFIRRKTWQQKLQELPSDAHDRLLGLVQVVEDSLHEPALGYPIALALHTLSLLSHLISPESDLSLSLLTGLDGHSTGGSGSKDSTSLFNGGNASRGPRRSLRRTMQINRAAAWSWTASVLSLTLVALSLYNAWRCLAARRRYRLWMRSADSKVASQNARLVPIHLDGGGDDDDDGNGSDQPTISERLIVFLLTQLHRIPILGALVPDAAYLGHNKHRPSLGIDAQIHELHVWQPPAVTLRVLTVYSPPAALLWHIVGGPFLPIQGIVAWLSFLVVVQGGLASMLVLVARLYEGLVKDKEVLAAEVMREYDEKFVLPRAMPAVRDASTMTTMEMDIGAATAASASRYESGGGASGGRDVDVSPSSPRAARRERMPYY